jgi:hypothetical protein
MSRISEPLKVSSDTPGPCSPWVSLSGLGLGEAFKQFVFEDPRVAELGAHVVSKEDRHQDVFAEGAFPAGSTRHGWRLDIGKGELAYAFVRPAAFFLPGPPLPKASDAIQAAAEAIVGRIQTFRRMLIDRTMVAYGTFERTGNFGPIHFQQWARQGLVVEINSGDLLVEVNGKPVVQWSGVVLDMAEERFDPRNGQHQNVAARPLGAVRSVSRELHRARPPTTRPCNPAKKLTRKMASTAAAIEALWSGQIPAGMDVRSRDDAIMGWQTENKMAVATPRTIRRYIESIA